MNLAVHRFAREHRLRDFDNAPPRPDLDSATSAGSNDLVGTGTFIAGVSPDPLQGVHPGEPDGALRLVPVPMGVIPTSP